MPLTPDEERVGKRADALLLQVESGGLFTLEDLARFILDVGHTNVSVGSSEYESELVNTTGMLCTHLLSLPNAGRRYHKGSLDNPQLTVDGVVQLLQMGSHAIAVAVRNYNGERLRGVLDKMEAAAKRAGK